MGSVPTPMGAFSAGVVVDPDAVGSALSQLLAQSRISSRQAVIAVPTEVVTARVLEVPAAPDAELLPIVDGEIRHFNIIQEAGGAFDFVKLPQPKGKRADIMQLLVMAAEDRTMAGLRAVAKKTGLRPLRYEPAAVGMLRCAAERIEPDETALIVIISDIRADLAVVSKGTLALFRRLDFGSVDLLGAPADGSGGDGSLVESVVASFATEVKRSIDYFDREYSGLGDVSKVVVAMTDARLLPFVDSLHKALRMEVVAASIPDSAIAPNLATSAAPPSGLRFNGAYGLASTLDSVATQPIGLISRDQVPAEIAAVRRSLLVSLVCSIVIVIAGGAAATWFSAKANRHELVIEHLKVDLEHLEKNELPVALARVAELDTLRVLAKDGVPFTRLMDGVVAAMHPQASLSLVEFTQEGTVKIKGEAVSEEAMIRTLESIRSFPFVQSALIESFSSMNVKDLQGAIEFEIAANYVGYAAATVANLGGM